jgi:hypothetical protein
MHARFRTTALLSTVLVAMLVAPALASAAPPTEGDTVVTTPNVYLRDQDGEPWGQETNDEAMARVFGDDLGGGVLPDGRHRYGFWRSVRVLGAVPLPRRQRRRRDELEAFLADHEAELKAFTDRGGRLFLNSAPNEGDGMSYDGRQLIDNDDTASGAVGAADPSHPIFNGPFTPVTNAYTASDFGHAVWQGAGLTPLIIGHQNNDSNAPLDPTRIVLAEYRNSCTGLTLLGGMTTHNWHEPQDEAANLRANMIAYAANTPPDCGAPTSAASGCVSTTELGVTVTDNLGGLGPASVRYTVDGEAEHTTTTDAPGNARITLPAGQHTVAFRGVDRAGNVEANPNSVTVTCQAQPGPAAAPPGVWPRPCAVYCAAPAPTRDSAPRLATCSTAAPRVTRCVAWPATTG